MQLWREWGGGGVGGAGGFRVDLEIKTYSADKTESNQDPFEGLTVANG